MHNAQAGPDKSMCMPIEKGGSDWHETWQKYRKQMQYSKKNLMYNKHSKF